MPENVNHRFRCAVSIALALCALFAQACASRTSISRADSAETRRERTDGADESWIKQNFEKREYMITMRDGVRLFTAAYIPRDRTQKYPILMRRTPYSCRPYGESKFPDSLGPSPLLMRDGYIFVFQDVRGRYMSEGEFVNMTPHVAEKRSELDIDESTDCFDTIEYLLREIPNNNGRVGLWGISYPGFYAAASMIDAHPALRAVSPQAPIADWWYDDFHHHGAFFLPHTFGFFYSFGKPRPIPTTESGDRIDYKTPDGYQFYLELGPLSNINEKYYKNEVAFWNETIEHPNYDEFWQSRNILPHLNNVAPAVMTVGGWFDAEDLYGPLKIYRSIEQKNSNVFNILVMGPWVHGGWARTEGDHLGDVAFDAPTSRFYQAHVEQKFFNHFLKDDSGRSVDLPEALVFETGANQWREFAEWPPKGLSERELYLRAGSLVSWDPPTGDEDRASEYVSDPAKPVPFTETVANGMTREYMTDDQRFAARRPDVVVFQTEVLDDDITLAGPITADLWVSTSGQDSDWVVKVIDVFPPDAEDNDFTADHRHMGNYHMMVRSEVIRGRFRNSAEKPEPFVPNQPTKVRFELQDVLHTFKKGHRIQVQIQSTWFPLVDRNPQSWVDNIYKAEADDFIVATQRVLHSSEHPSRLEIGVLPPRR